MKISLLISSLPSQSTTARMRIWRSLKSNGAATLRDGVYLLPVIHSEKFESVVMIILMNMVMPISFKLKLLRI